MKISPGNLYYHFKNKEDIINNASSSSSSARSTAAHDPHAPDGRLPNVEDAWLFLHLLFEQIWKYRFFYRDLNNLLANNRTLRNQLQVAADPKGQVARRLC